MPSPRLVRRATAVVALAALLALAASMAPGRPADKDKKDKNTKSIAVVDIAGHLYDYDTNAIPYSLKVNYSTDVEGLEVALVEYSGKAVPAQNAPPPSGTLTFTLDYNFDTTGEDLRVVLREKANPTTVYHSDKRYGLTFIGDGMMMWSKPFKFDAPKGTKMGEKAKKAGGPISAGFHHGHFPGYDNPMLGASARMWVQGKFAQGPLKTDYDLSAGLVWLPRSGKWYPCWSKLLTEPHKAHPLKPKGEDPKTVVRVLLLDAKGKVLHIMTYPHH